MTRPSRAIERPSLLGLGAELEAAEGGGLDEDSNQRGGDWRRRDSGTAAMEDGLGGSCTPHNCHNRKKESKDCKQFGLNKIKSLIYIYASY